MSVHRLLGGGPTAVWTLLVALGGVMGCGDWQVGSDPPADDVDGGESGAPGEPVATEYPKGFHVVGNRLEDIDGNRVSLRGVNRSGSEYKCVQGGGIFDGPDDDASIAAMLSWGVNAVRVPLNESCWLSLNGSPGRFSGANYKAAIIRYVQRLHVRGIIPILDLHWVAPGEELALAPLRPMPDADHAVDFWMDVASTFLDDEGVILEPFNEPFPDLNRDTETAWQCWRDGCETAQYGRTETYAAVGMQALVDAIRETGSRHLILLGGVQYANGLTRWLEYKPSDPLENLAVAWHIYNNNPCRDLGCWNDVPAQLAATFPIVATEIGQNDCAGETFLKPLMQFLDEHGSGYLAWSWNALGVCMPTIPRGSQGTPWFLITDYESAEPNSAYAQTFYDHLLGVSP